MAGVIDTSELVPHNAATGIPDNYQTEHANPDMFGAAVGQALTRSGSELEQTGQFFSQVQADSAVNQLLDYDTKVKYGDPSKPGDQGFYGLKGADALNAKAGVLQQYDDYIAKQRSQLTGYGQLQYDQMSRRYRNYFASAIGQHAQQQQDLFTNETNRATGDLNLTAIANASNTGQPNQQIIDFHKEQMITAAEKQAQQQGATGPNDPISVHLVEQAKAQALKAQILSMSSTPAGAAAAQKYLEDHKEDAGLEYGQLSQHLKAAASQYTVDQGVADATHQAATEAASGTMPKHTGMSPQGGPYITGADGKTYATDKDGNVAGGPVTPASAVVSAPPTGGDFTGSLIHFESGGRNVQNNDKTTSSGRAQGYFQITTGTWKEFAERAGVDLSAYPNAMSAPYAVQARLASIIPMGRWAPETLNYLRQHGFAIDTHDTLAENVARNGGKLGATPPPGTTLMQGDQPAADAMGIPMVPPVIEQPESVSAPATPTEAGQTGAPPQPQPAIYAPQETSPAGLGPLNGSLQQVALAARAMQIWGARTDITPEQRESGFIRLRQNLQQAQFAADSTEHAVKEASNNAAKGYIPRLVAGDPSVRQAIASDPNLEFGTQMELLRFRKEAQPNDLGPSYNDALKRIALPYGDPNRISNYQQLLQMRNNGQLSDSGLTKVGGDMEKLKHEDYQGVVTAKSAILNQMKGYMTYGEEGNFPGALKDPKGQAAYDQFAVAFEADFDAFVNKGGNPFDFLKDQKGIKAIADSIRSPEDKRMDQISEQGGNEAANYNPEAQNAPVAPPPTGIDQDTWNKAIDARPSMQTNQGPQKIRPDAWANFLTQLMDKPPEFQQKMLTSFQQRFHTQDLAPAFAALLNAKQDAAAEPKLPGTIDPEQRAFQVGAFPGQGQPVISIGQSEEPVDIQPAPAPGPPVLPAGGEDPGLARRREIYERTHQKPPKPAPASEDFRLRAMEEE